MGRHAKPPYFKMEITWLDDPRAVRLTEGERYLLVVIYTLGKRSPRQGWVHVRPGIPYKPEELNALARRPDDQVGRTEQELTHLKDHKFLHINSKGIRILDWDHLQPKPYLDPTAMAYKQERYRRRKEKILLRNKIEVVTQQLRNYKAGDVRRETGDVRQDKDTTLPNPPKAAVRPKSAGANGKVPTALQEVIDHYRTVKGFTDPAEATMIYQRSVRTATQLLHAASGNVALVQQSVTEIGRWLDGKGLSEWTLDAVAKNFAQWHKELKNGHGGHP